MCNIKLKLRDVFKAILPGTMQDDAIRHSRLPELKDINCCFDGKNAGLICIFCKIVIDTVCASVYNNAKQYKMEKR